VKKAIQKLLTAMRANARGIAFSDAVKVAEYFFGAGRQNGSHVVFKMPWPGDPRVNLQKDKDEAKPYQVRQLVAAIDRMEPADAKEEIRIPAKPGRKGKRSG
jgi:hypothetical protein